MQRESERDLVAAWQQGNLTAARQLVGMLQSEALNVAYLLTGEREDAVALAESGFLALFEQSRTGDLDSDRRIQLLTQMAQSFVRGDYRSRIDHSAIGGLFLDSGPVRFNVDNRRTLLLAALGRLENRERAALVLHDFSGLEPADMSKLIDRRGGDPLIAPMEAARVRVRQSLDIPAGEHLRRIFVEAAFDAPRIELWTRLEEPVTEILQRGRNQTRIISAGIVAVIVVVLLAGTFALFGEDLLGEAEDGSGSAAQSAVTPTLLPAGPTVAQSIGLPPTPTPAGPTFPPASVPAWLLLETWHQESPQTSAHRTLTVFDPAIDGTRRLRSNGPVHLADGADQARFSPDGYQMVVFREELAGDQMHYYLTSFSTDSIGRQWETEVYSIDYDPRIDPTSHTPARLASAVTDDRVYSAVLTTNESPVLLLSSYFRRNGMPRGSVEIPLPSQGPSSRIFRGNVMLLAPPDTDNIYLIVESFGDTVNDWRAEIMTFNRLDLSMTDTRTMSADLSQGYWFWASQMTPDGKSLYGVHQNRSGTSSRVQFLELETGEFSTITLPFTWPVNFGADGLMPVISHDGQRIFILNQSGTEVAVVDLSRRRIERVFPLDRRGFEDRFVPRHEELVFGYWSALSADGSQLYLASWNQNSGNATQPSGIWVIDTSLWKLTHFIPVEGFINGIFLSPTEDAVYAQVWTANDARPTHEIVKVSTDGQPEVVQTFELPQSGVDYVWTRSPFQYFQTQYGRSPAVDHVTFADSMDFATLPRIEVTTGPEVVVAGRGTSIDVRIIDPVNGEPLTAQREDVRFDAAGGVTAFVHAPDQERQIVILGEVEPGIYHGNVTLPASGKWTVDIALTDSAGEPWISADAGRINVASSFAGSDGRDYVFRVSTTPGSPLMEEETLVKLMLVDVQSGVPLPEDVTVTMEQGDGAVIDLPEEVHVSFTSVDPGYLTVRLAKVGSGLYEGTTRFWSDGPWPAFIRIQPDDQSQFTIPANTIEVRAS